jgi:hypothetical protein
MAGCFCFANPSCFLFGLSQKGTICSSVKLRFLSKMIIFEETLKFKNAIILSYGRQWTMTSQHIDPKFELWAIAKAFTHVLNLVVIACVMN